MAHCYGSPGQLKKEMGLHTKFLHPSFEKAAFYPLKPRKPLPGPNNPDFLNDSEKSLEINNLSLLPSIRWDIEMKPFWNIGEDGANKRLSEFLR